MSEPAASVDVRLIQTAVRFWRRRRKTALLVMLAALAVIVLLSGIFTVPTNMTGAVFTFGNLTRDDIAPGIHFKLPPPIQRVVKTNTSEMRRMNLAGEWREVVSMVTGDENIIELDIALQYKISDYNHFLIGAEDWSKITAEVISAAVTELVAGMNVDEVLTTGKSEIQVNLRTLAQKTLDRYQAGVSIVSTTLVAVRPPSEAAASFRRVADAKSEKSKKINIAEGRGTSEMSRARGRAEQILREAESQADERVKKASGDAERYLAILKEYRQARQVTRTDLYMKKMETVINRARIVLLDPGQNAIDLTLFGATGAKQNNQSGN